MGSFEAKDDLIYDWNTKGIPAKPKNLLLDDETLRDGLQSPSVQDPRIEDKIPLAALYG